MNLKKHATFSQDQLTLQAGSGKTSGQTDVDQRFSSSSPSTSSPPLFQPLPAAGHCHDEADFGSIWSKQEGCPAPKPAQTKTSTCHKRLAEEKGCKLTPRDKNEGPNLFLQVVKTSFSCLNGKHDDQLLLQQHPRPDSHPTPPHVPDLSPEKVISLFFV